MAFALIEKTTSKILKQKCHPGKGKFCSPVAGCKRFIYSKRIEDFNSDPNLFDVFIFYIVNPPQKFVFQLVDIIGVSGLAGKNLLEVA